MGFFGSGGELAFNHASKRRLPLIADWFALAILDATIISESSQL